MLTVLSVNWEGKKYSGQCKGILTFERPFYITKVRLDLLHRFTWFFRGAWDKVGFTFRWFGG